MARGFDVLSKSKHLTKSSTNAEEPCEHTVSWNRVQWCTISTNVGWIAFENACNRWM